MQSFVKINPHKLAKSLCLFTDIGKSNFYREFFYIPNMCFNPIRKNKVLAKISEFTVAPGPEVFDARSNDC